MIQLPADGEGMFEASVVDVVEECGQSPEGNHFVGEST